MTPKKTSTRIRRAKSITIQFLEKLNGGLLSFGQMLCSIRMCNEESQTDFARKLGVSKAHLCDLEKGRRTVSLSRAYAWGGTLRYSPEQFVELAIQTGLDHDKLAFKVKLVVA